LKELVPTFREYGDVIWVRSHFQETREVNRLEAVSDHVIADTPTKVGEKQAEAGADDPEGSPGPSKKAKMSNEATNRPATAEDLFERIETGHPGLSELQDEDEELFLTETAKREPCCIPGSFGAEYATQIKDLVDPTKDIEVVKTFYSAFGSTSLLLTLRSRLITELFICGCITNLSVFATAMDAARYGIKVTLIEDCLGYRRKDRHELAMKQLREIMEADVAVSTEVIERLRNPPESPEEEQDDELYEDDDDEVAVGEDAPATSSDLIEVDSGDEEEDVLPIVRSYASNRPIQLRYASSPLRSGLLEPSTAGHQPTASTEPTEPSGTRAALAGGVADDGRYSTNFVSNASGQRRKSENNLERGFHHSTDTEGIGDGGVDESSRRVISHQPWIGAIIDKSRAEEDKACLTPSGRSTHPGLDAISALVGLSQSVVDDMANMMAEARLNNSLEDKRELDGMPLFGEGKENESGGSRIMFDLLPPEVAESIFEELNREVTWQKMYHQTGKHIDGQRGNSNTLNK
jgi:nicotinamidase-related amidase